jgi:hypothetical protein
MDRPYSSAWSAEPDRRRHLPSISATSVFEGQDCSTYWGEIDSIAGEIADGAILDGQGSSGV